MSFETSLNKVAMETICTKARRQFKELLNMFLEGNTDLKAVEPPCRANDWLGSIEIDEKGHLGITGDVVMWIRLDYAEGKVSNACFEVTEHGVKHQTSLRKLVAFIKSQGIKIGS